MTEPQEDITPVVVRVEVESVVIRADGTREPIESEATLIQDEQED